MLTSLPLFFLPIRDLARTAQCTVTVTVAVVCPNAFVAYNVYVVVAVGITTTLDPRTAPTCGETITYPAPVCCHDSVTCVPEETDVALAVNDAICGAAPVGTLADVYTGDI